MKLTHLGHACLLVETDGARLLFDPGTMSAFDDVRHLDGVLVTHQHPDHLDPARVGSLLVANPRATLWVDADTVTSVPGLPTHRVVRTGDKFPADGATVEVAGGLHAAVYGAVPGCTNAAYLVDDGAFFHPGDSFTLPGREVDVLAVAVDGPWLKLAEAVDYVRAARPRVAVPIHEGETPDPAKYAGMRRRSRPRAWCGRCRAPRPWRRKVGSTRKEADDADTEPGAWARLRSAPRQRRDPAQGGAAGGAGRRRRGRACPARRAPAAQRGRGSH